MEVNLLSGAMGAEVKGIDLKDSSDKNWEVVNSLMLEHKALFFRNQILLVKIKLIWQKNLVHLKDMYMLKV